MKIAFAVLPTAGAAFELDEKTVRWLVAIIPKKNNALISSCRATSYALSIGEQIGDMRAIQIFVIEVDNELVSNAINETTLYALIELNNKRWMDPNILHADTIGADVRFDEFLQKHKSVFKRVLDVLRKPDSLNCSIEGLDDPFIPLMSGDMLIELKSQTNQCVYTLLENSNNETRLSGSSFFDLPARQMH